MSTEIAQTVSATIAVLILIVVVALIMALPTMWLANYVLSPEALAAVFGGPLTVLKALALNVLCAILIRTSASKS